MDKQDPGDAHSQLNLTPHPSPLTLTFTLTPHFPRPHLLPHCLLVLALAPSPSPFQNGHDYYLFAMPILLLLLVLALYFNFLSRAKVHASLPSPPFTPCPNTPPSFPSRGSPSYLPWPLLAPNGRLCSRATHTTSEPPPSASAARRFPGTKTGASSPISPKYIP